MTDRIRRIKQWHEKARPHPTPAQFSVQLGCHLEEIHEMISTLEFMMDDRLSMFGEETVLFTELKRWADRLKSGLATANIRDRKEFLDSAADQIVTAVGAAYCTNMNIVEAVKRVDDSNWSKYDEKGNPRFDAKGKIAKGDNYFKPDLQGLY